MLRNFFRKRKPLPGTLAPRFSYYALWNQRLERWRKLAMFLAFLQPFTVGGYIIYSLQDHVRPYVVSVDRSGFPRLVGPAPRASRDDPRIVKALLVDWIWSARTVTPDGELQENLLKKAQSYTLGQAREELVAHLAENRNPYGVSAGDRVSVRVESVMPIGESEKEWEVVWYERRRSDLDASTAEKWKALVAITWKTPEREDYLALNPLGFRIETLNWTRLVWVEE